LSAPQNKADEEKEEKSVEMGKDELGNKI